MDQTRLAQIYDAYYYAHGCGRPYQRDEEWLRFFGNIAGRIVSDIAPRTVLDAGCAMGFLVEELRCRGVEAFGIDISEHAIANVHPEIRPFCRVGSISEPLPQRYDLIVSIEVLEHMPQADAEQAIANLCAHTDDIIFSSTPFDYKEVSHFNVHAPEYWAMLFARNGFLHDVDFDGSVITPWAVRFRRSNQPLPRVVADYERRFWPLWKENTDLRDLTLEQREELANLSQHALNLQANIKRLLAQAAEREREIGGLRAHIAEKDRRLAALNRRSNELEAEVLRKNEHIGQLEDLIRRIEAGRVMRLMRALRGAPPSVAPPSADGAAVVDSTPAPAPADLYLDWIRANEPDAAVLMRQRDEARRWADSPLLTVITPVFNPPVAVLREAIESVLAQTYERWELVLVDGGSEAPGIRETLDEYARRDQRIVVRYLGRNYGISGNSNEALAIATGEFVVLLDHDDLLAPNLLYEAAVLLRRDPALDIIYYDEDKISDDGRVRREPWFKPAAYSPDLLLSVNYLMHGLVRRSLLAEAGGFDPRMDGAQDWDLALRLVERTQRMAHIPRVLYHWRQIEGSAARDASAKPWAFAAQEACVTAHLRRIGLHDPQVSFPSLGRVRVHWPTSGALVSIIIPTRDRLDLLRPCLESIFARTDYPTYEIVLVDTGSTDPATQAYYRQLGADERVRIVRFEGPFNWSAANNFGVQHASGTLLLFLNNDTEALEANWLGELAGWAERPEVGVVGAKLIRPDGTIQHAGVVMGVAGHGSHPFDGDTEGVYGPFGSPEWYRDYLAVTGACMIMRRSVFEQLGGFDEIYQVAYSDLEFCLRAGAAGYRVVYTPFARVLHHEGGSRGFDQPPSDVLRATLQMRPVVLEGDPYFNPNLSRMERRPTFARPDEETADERLLHILKIFNLVDAGCFEVQPPPAPPLPMRSAVGVEGVRGSTRPRRLVLIGHDLSRSGAPLILCALGRALKARGYDVAVFAGEDGPLRERYAADGIPVTVDRALIDDARHAAAPLREGDLVLANTILGFRSIYAARALGLPSIWWIHESRFGQELAQDDRWIARAFRAADAVMFPARATARLYEAFGDPQRFVAIHTGLELRREARLRSPFAPREGVTRAILIGSIEPRKGQDLLLRALAALPPDLATRLEVYLVGRVLDWAFYGEVETLAKTLPNVQIVGEAAHDRVIAYLQWADIFICASRDEVLPISVLEAMAYGKPIVATDVGGVAEIVEDGVQGLIVPADDPRALAGGIARLAGDPALAEQLGRQAQARFDSELTIERFAADVEHLLERVAEAGQ